MQAVRIFAIFVWSKKAPDHINPAAPEGGMGRLYQFISKTSFRPRNTRGADPSSWLDRKPGPRVPAEESEKPNLLIRLGDPSELIATNSQSYNQLHVRRWWPADEASWVTAIRASGH